MFEKLTNKQQKEAEKILKRDEKRLSAVSKGVLDYLATQEITVGEAKMVVEGIVKGITTVLEAKTRPTLLEHRAKQFKDFYAESEQGQAG